MNQFKAHRRPSAKQLESPLGEPKPAKPDESGLEKKTDRRRKDKSQQRSEQFNTKVRKEFMKHLDEALQQFCSDKRLDTVSRGYFLEVLLYNWMQAHGKEVRPYGLPPLALEHAEAIADRMSWTVEQAIEDAIAARCKDLQIDLNERRGRR